MEGINLFDDNVATTSGSQAATADSDNAVQKKVLKKRAIEFVVVSYKDPKTKMSWVSALPTHWVDNRTLWYPPKNGSENPTQAVNHTTWRRYPIRNVYWETITKERNQCQADADKIYMKERAEAATSTDSDVPQVQQRTSKPKSDSVVAKQVQQPPSAPLVNVTAKKRVSDCTEDIQRKRARCNSLTDLDQEPDQPADPPRRSPRKHPGSMQRTTSPPPSQPTMSPPLRPTLELLSSADALTSQPPSEPTMSPPLRPTFELPSSADALTSQPPSEPTMSPPLRPTLELPSSADALTSPTAESTPKTATNSRWDSNLLDHINRSVSQAIIQSNQYFSQAIDRLTEAIEKLNANIETSFSDVKLRLENRQSDTSSVANSSMNSVGLDSAAVLPRCAGVERLTAEQRSIVGRVPVVSTDDQNGELEGEVKRSGRDGAFFEVLVRTLADRSTNKSDANKTANSVLRALYKESYLAERVTMAGYKRSKVTESGRDYGEPGKRFIALARSSVYPAVFQAIKLACHSKTTDDKIKKAIRDGINTLRLHDKERRKQLSRQLAKDDDTGDHDSQSSPPTDTDIPSGDEL